MTGTFSHRQSIILILCFQVWLHDIPEFHSSSKETKPISGFFYGLSTVLIFTLQECFTGTIDPSILISETRFSLSTPVFLSSRCMKQLLQLPKE